MADNYVYEADVIDVILGKGMLYNNQLNLQEIAVMLYKRYRIVVEASYLPNVGKFVPIVRTIAYVPRDVQERFGRVIGTRKLANNLNNIGRLIDRFKNEDYYKVLSIAIRIAELYLLKNIIYKDNEDVLKLINDEVQYERVAELIGEVDNPDILNGIVDHAIDEVNVNYITGSILWELTEHIKKDGWTKGK